MQAWSRWWKAGLLALLGTSFLLYYLLMILSERWATGSWEYLEKKRIIQGGLLSVAFLVVCCSRRANRAALLGACLLAATATAPLFPFEEMLVHWRVLPRALQLLLWPAQLSHFMILPLFFIFYAMQPRPLFQARWAWVAACAPVAAPAAWGIRQLFGQIQRGPMGVDAPAWILLITGIGILIYGFGGLLAMTLNYARLQEQDERTRFRVFLMGSWLGWGPGLLFLSSIFLGPLNASPAIWFFVSPAYKQMALLCWMLVPLTLCWAALRDKAFEERPTVARPLGMSPPFPGTPLG